MKKTISFLMSLSILFTLCNASCDELLTIQFDCNVQPELSNLWQIWDNGTTVQMTSSMHKDYLIEFQSFPYSTFIPYDYLMLMNMQHSVLDDLLSLLNRITESEAKTERGFFTGDCFDMAVFKQEITLDSDLIDQMIMIQSAQDSAVTAYHSNDITIEWLYLIKNFIRQTNLTLRAKIYDHGKYYTFQAEKNNKVIITLSLNRIDIVNTNGVFSFSEEDRVYDIGFQSMADKNNIYLTVSICSDPDQAGYRIACTKHSIIHMECRFYLEYDNKLIKYDGILSSADEKTAMTFIGNIRPITENELLSLNILYSRDNKTWGNIRITKENTEFHRNTKYVVSAENENDGAFKLLKTSYEQYFMVLLNRLVNPSFS